MELVVHRSILFLGMQISSERHARHACLNREALLEYKTVLQNTRTPEQRRFYEFFACLGR